MLWLGVLLTLLATKAGAAERRPIGIHVPLTLQVGGYRPPLSAVLGGGLSFESVFGTSRRPIFRVGSGVGLSSSLGSIDLLGNIGIWRASGTVPALGGGLDPKLDEVSLWILPISVQLLGSIDVLHHLFDVPLAPFGRAGFGVARWSFSRVETSQGIGRGWAAGPEVAVGLQLILDGIDPRLTKEAENEFHLRSSRLACEWSWMSWGTAESVDLSGSGFGCSLLLMF